MIRRSLCRLASVASLYLLFTASAEASMQYRVDDDALAPLNAPVKLGAKLKIANVPLINGEPATLELEAFNVLAPDAVIEVHREDGTVEHVKPRPMKQFRGRVAGSPDSLVYLSVGTRTEGLVLLPDRKFSVYSRPVRSGQNQRLNGYEVYVEEVPAHEDVLSAGGFTCAVEGQFLTPSSAKLAQSLSVSDVGTNAYAWPSDTARTTLNLAVDADSAMYANFANNATTVETYVRNLIGAASTIYLRDLRTELRITLLAIWTSGGGADPFTINPDVTSGTWNGVPDTDHETDHALAEYGDWFHANRASTKRSAAMLLSGQPALAGIAWIQTLCSNGGTCSGGNCGSPVFDGHRWGSYSYNGGVGREGTGVPNPDGGVNYVAPSTNYWSLLQIAHELGHNVQSPHTHCIDTNAGLAGIQPVDACVGGCVPQGSVPLEKGTIMSYCHLRHPGYATNTRYTFGKTGELSEIVLTNMRAALDVRTPTGLSTITAPDSLTIGVTDAASVTATAGLTFDWTITNGTFTGGGTTATGASISFSGTASPVTLTVTATNNNGCAVTDTTTVTIEEEEVVARAPPINVLAAATGTTTVDVSWAASAGATEYDVWRSAGAGSFALVGSAGDDTTFTDSTAVANTSYRYVVRAGTNGLFSTFSDDDVATTVVFTDPILTTATRVKVVHFTQLLTAVNAIRTLAGLGAVTFTAPTPATDVTLRRQHILDLRTALDAARGSIGLPALTYTDETITAGSTRAKGLHVSELRNGVN